MQDCKYICKHCNGIANIQVIRDTEKATVPNLEFCPFCGMSNLYSKELDEKYNITLDTTKTIK